MPLTYAERGHRVRDPQLTTFDPHQRIEACQLHIAH